MSNGVSDFGKNVLGLSQQDIKALNTVSSVIGLISSVWGYFNAAKSVLAQLGLFPQSDQIAQLRQAIDELWRNFQAVIAALDTEGTMRDVDNQRSLGENELQNLQEFAPEDPSATGVNPQWDSLIAEVLDNSSLAVVTLGKSSYWQRVFFPELVYSPPWPGPSDQALLFTPQHQSGLVFDYRLTLPAYLEVISIRLTILVAVVKHYLDNSKDELNTMATTLEGYFNQIRNGIIELGPPVPGWEENSNLYNYYAWEQQNTRFGVVEIYSTFNLVDYWPRSEFPWVVLSVPYADEKFLTRYCVRTLRRWKQVFNNLGLGAAAAVLLKLKVLAGISPAAIDGQIFDAFNHAPTGDWSLRELAQRLSAIWRGYTIGPHDQLRSLGQVLQVLQTFNPQPYTSLRSALAQ